MSLTNRRRALLLVAAVLGTAFAAWTVPSMAAGAGTPAGISLPSPSVLPSLPVPTPRLPTPPLPSPSLPTSLPLPTPSLPAGVLPSPSAPPVGGVLPTPTPTAGSTPGGGKSSGAPAQQGASASSGGGSRQPHGISVPFTSIVLSSPLDAAVFVAVAVLPLLLGIWLLLFGRTWNEARKARDARIRMALANDLGLSPRELGSLSTKGLFKLREQAAFDDLTGVLRRAAGVAAAEHEIVRARRHKSPLTVAFLDVDGLKQINDGSGHAGGDQILRGLVSGLKGRLRGQDIVLRYGGDEFVCVLPDTVAEAAEEKLRQIQSDLAPEGIGFSFGLAQLERSDDVVSILGRADTSLYEAKARRGSLRPLRPEVRQGDESRKRVPA